MPVVRPEVGLTRLPEQKSMLHAEIFPPPGGGRKLPYPPVILTTGDVFMLLR